ncbi:MAG: neutral zinc metallopeptidase [Bacteroidaceae bacterium]|nr:neutral zinc metallopeptidase [Bacteroidaceae bacterium]
MKLDGRRESTNVDDRRGKSTKMMLGGGGIIGAIIAGIMLLMQGGSMEQVIGTVTEQMQHGQVSEQPAEGQKFTPEEQELAKFSKQILASTEDVWAPVFQKMGKTYTPPTMVLYTGSVSTGCGNGSASMGPFYCSADQCLYIDLSFFSNMKRQLGADGDFAYAYVIAHEVGHHVEFLLGSLQQAHEKMSRLNEKEANKVSVRLELLADFYAGVWGHHEKKTFGSLDDGDLQEAIKCAEVIGDNYLQEKARGYSTPETFTHGTSAQRMKWLKRGLNTGDMSQGTTFQCSDSEL